MNLELKNYILRKALEQVVEWQMPRTGKFSNGAELSFAYCYGSKGEREFIRGIAQEALNEIGNS